MRKWMDFALLKLRDEMRIRAAFVPDVRAWRLADHQLVTHLHNELARLKKRGGGK